MGAWGRGGRYWRGLTDSDAGCAILAWGGMAPNSECRIAKSELWSGLAGRAGVTGDKGQRACGRRVAGHVWDGENRLIEIRPTPRVAWASRPPGRRSIR
jgi:hypothetical protein